MYKEVESEASHMPDVLIKILKDINNKNANAKALLLEKPYGYNKEFILGHIDGLVAARNVIRDELKEARNK